MFPGVLRIFWKTFETQGRQLDNERNFEKFPQKILQEADNKTLFCNKVNHFIRRSKCLAAAAFEPRLLSSEPRLSRLTINLNKYTVKLARAKLLANAGNFTCSSKVKRSLAHFTCVTCSLPVNTGKFTCFEAASTSRRTQANCQRAHVNLPEYHKHFTDSFTCGTHANLPTTSMQNCLLLQAKIHATCKNTGIAGKNTRQTQAKNLQFHAKLPALAGNLQSHRG